MTHAVAVVGIRRLWVDRLWRQVGYVGNQKDFKTLDQHSISTLSGEEAERLFCSWQWIMIVICYIVSIAVSGSLNRWSVIYNHPIGSIYHLITTFTLPIGWLLATCHLLREPGNSIDCMHVFNLLFLSIYVCLYIYKYVCIYLLLLIHVFIYILIYLKWISDLAFSIDPHMISSTISIFTYLCLCYTSLSIVI